MEERDIVTKTRKPWGYHIHFRAEDMHYDLRGDGYELKVCNGLVTLPFSSHRDDKNFVYTPAVAEGRDPFWDTPKVAFWNKEKVTELLNLLKEFGQVRVGADVGDDGKNDITITTIINPSYTPGSIDGQTSYKIATALYEKIQKYYIRGHRNDVILVLVGVLYRRGVALNDAKQIIQIICSLAGDKEVESRIATLEGAYKKGKGAGRPKLSTIIKSVTGCSKYESGTIANNLVGELIQIIRREIPDPHINITIPQRQSLGGKPNPISPPGGNKKGGDGGDDDGDDDDNDSLSPSSRDKLAKFCPKLIPTLDRYVYRIMTLKKTSAKIVIANNDEHVIRLAEIIEETTGYGDTKEVRHKLLDGDDFAKCIPTDIKRIIDPLYEEVRWQFNAVTRDGKHWRYGPAPLKTIFEQMGADNMIFRHQASWLDVLSILLEAYNEIGKVQTLYEVKSPGLYILRDHVGNTDGKKKVFLLANKLDLHNPTKDELLAATKAIEHLYKEHFTTETTRMRLAHIIKLAVVSPLSFARRQLNAASYGTGFVPGLIMSGESESGKTYGYGGLLLTINRLDSNEYVRSVRDYATVPRLTYFLSYSTFPMIFDEADFLTELLQRPQQHQQSNISSLIGMLKNAIANIDTGRMNKNSERVIEFLTTVPILTLNGHAPSEDGTLRRYVVWEFTKNDRMRDKKLIDCFNRDMTDRWKDALGVIGDFRTQFILDEVNNKGNIDILTKTKWHELGTIILRKMYEMAGVPYPEWLDKYVDVDSQSLTRTRDDVRNERIDDLISCARKTVSDAWAKHRSEFNYVATGERENTRDKLQLLLEHTTALPDFRYDRERDRVLITSSFLKTAQRSGVDRVGNLKQLAEYLNLDHIRIRFNGENRWFVVCDRKRFADLIDGYIDSDDGYINGGGNDSDNNDDDRHDNNNNNNNNNNDNGNINTPTTTTTVTVNINNTNTISKQSTPTPSSPASESKNELVTKQAVVEKKVMAETTLKETAEEVEAAAVAAATAVIQHRIDLVTRAYQELISEGMNGVEESELIGRLCDTKAFLPPWHLYDGNSIRKTRSSLYVTSHIQVMGDKGLLEWVTDNSTGRRNVKILTTPVKKTMTMEEIENEAVSAAIDVIRQRNNLVWLMYQELLEKGNDKTKEGVNEEELMAELCKTKAFLPLWTLYDNDENIDPCNYVVSHLAVMLSKGMLEWINGNTLRVKSEPILTSDMEVMVKI